MAMLSNIYITHIDKEGPFLKIWGQTERNLSVYVEKSLQQLLPQFEQGSFTPSQGSIQVGVMCCAKYKDGLFYRARITNIINQNIVEVHFIDYGNKDIIPNVNIRTVTSLSATLLSIPPQAREFILAGIMHRGQTWDENVIAIINNEIRYVELQLSPIGTVGNYTLIKLFRNGEDIMNGFINRGLVSSVTFASQQQILHNFSSTVITNIQSPVTNILPQNPISPMQSVTNTQAAPQPALLNYKLFSLEPGSEHDVYVSYVSDGPCHFSVQLQKLEDILSRLMKEINRMPLQPLEDDPLPGTVCVARCSEDNHICRAVVTSVVDNLYKIFYVDFGNTELLSIDNLYQIPFKFVIPKVMAMRYALAGLDRSSVTLEMKCAFKEFVKEKLLHMRVLPAPARSALPLCELWDENNVNVLDVIRRAALVAYPEPVQLTRGFSQEIHVSFVYSCSRFYVQLKSKEEELRRVMAELQNSCPHKPPLQLNQIKIGQPCCALFDADGYWYRAQVLSIENEQILVHYVDYGNDERVPLQNLRIPQGELLTVLRPQALECCLNGYQKMDVDIERDSFLEELILEKDFTMKVVEMQGSKALVELTDSNRYNIASLLLEKLATAHSQVSPLLIQDGHKIEQRKRSSPAVPPYGKQRDDNREKSRRPFGNKDQTNKGWDHQRDKSEKILNNSDNWSSTSSTDEKLDWRQRKPPRGRDDRKGDKENVPKRDGSVDNSWGDAVNKNKFNRNRENRVEDRHIPDKFGKGKGNRDGWAGQDRAKGEGWGNQEKGNRDGWGNHDKSSRDKWNNQDKEKFGRNKRWRDDHSNVRAKSPNFSDKSFSDGSEKNWRSKPRTGFKNEEKPGKGPGKGSFNKNNSWNSSTAAKSWDASPATTEPLDFAPADAAYSFLDMNNKTETVSICWFYDPAHFYCQLEKSKNEFRNLMEEIQSKYHNRPSGGGSILVGSPVIALFPDDGVLYRAVVLEIINDSQWKVQYVDFGNVTATDKVWPIDKKFMEMPIQAVLSGLAVAPSESVWPDPDVFSSYFDKESYTCTFTVFDNEKYIVELTDNDVNVRELLISASLAKPLGLGLTEPTYPQNAEISLLLGQQIRVTLSDVKKLDDFKIILPNKQELQCSLHNLSSAEQIWEDLLKQVVGYTIIIYVDDIIDNRLEVTIYDTTGNKLKLIEPDENSLDWVESLCPMPVLSSEVTGWITHFTSNSAYIQPSSFANTVAHLLETMFNFYDNSTLETPLEPQDGFIYAVHSSDSNWYRGRVITIDGEQITILYLDYGNSEVVNVSELRELALEYLELHILALEIFLSNPLEQLPETEVTVKIWYGEQGWEGEFMEIAKEVLQKEVPTEVQNDQEAVPTEEILIQQKSDSLPSLGVAVILSHFDSPSEFYLQLTESLDNINSLQDKLQELIPNLQDLENPTAGVLCAAQYSLDQVWYRCQVLDADNDITSVRFVDYGNTDVLDNTTTKVKTLPPDLLCLEQYAQRCSLCLKPDGDEWSQAAFDRFEQLTDLGNLSVKIIHQDEKTTYVELYTNGDSISEKLLEEGLAKELVLETESSCTGYISHLNSPSEFWIQLENSVGDLEWIAEQLSVAENFSELEDLAPGSLCAALFPEDEMWYRARILSNTVAGLEVIFIDYGNSCTCSGLRQLPEDLILLPPLALKCSLEKPPGIIQWSPLATEKFKEISADGATIFNVHKITTGETSIVNLFLDEESIVNKLLPETVEGYISHFESVDNFWIQKSEASLELDMLTAQMLNAADWPIYQSSRKTDQLVAALYPADECWYRAKILKEIQKEDSTFYEVLFVDYGNSAETDAVHELIDELCEKPPLAINCKLDPLPGQRWTAESSEKLALLSNSGQSMFNIEFVSNDTVRLYLNGEDIRSDLNSVPASSVHSTPKKNVILNQSEDVADDVVKEIYTDALNLIEASDASGSVINELNVVADEKIEIASESLLTEGETDSEYEEKQTIETITKENATKETKESTKEAVEDAKYLLNEIVEKASLGENDKNVVKEAADVVHNDIQQKEDNLIDKSEMVRKTSSEDDTTKIKEYEEKNNEVTAILEQIADIVHNDIQQKEDNLINKCEMVRKTSSEDDTTKIKEYEEKNNEVTAILEQIINSIDGKECQNSNTQIYNKKEDANQDLKAEPKESVENSEISQSGNAINVKVNVDNNDFTDNEKVKCVKLSLSDKQLEEEKSQAKGVMSNQDITDNSDFTIDGRNKKQNCGNLPSPSETIGEEKTSQADSADSVLNKKCNIDVNEDFTTTTYDETIKCDKLSSEQTDNNDCIATTDSEKVKCDNLLPSSEQSAEEKVSQAAKISNKDNADNKDFTVVTDSNKVKCDNLSPSGEQLLEEKK